MVSVSLVARDETLVAAQLLHDFNTEFDTPSPGTAWLAQRLSQLLRTDTTKVLLAGVADGVAVVRLRPALWSEGLEAYLAELYVVPQLRGNGIGSELLMEVFRQVRAAGAKHLEVTTTEDDVAARKLYEKFGFTRFESGDQGLSFYYEVALT